MILSTTEEIRYETKRCSGCGAFWAVETDRNFGSNKCPVCSGERFAARNAENEHLRATITSLRGVITRMKKAKKS